MNDDPADAPRFRQPHIGPGFAGVDRLVDPVSHYIAVANHPCFAGAGPHRVRLGGCHRERADRGRGLLVEYRRPAVAAIHRFPDAARGCSGVVHARVTGNSCDGCDAVPDLGSHEAESEVAFYIGVHRRRSRRGHAAEGRQRGKQAPERFFVHPSLSPCDHRHGCADRVRLDHQHPVPWVHEALFGGMI